MEECLNEFKAQLHYLTPKTISKTTNWLSHSNVLLFKEPLMGLFHERFIDTSPSQRLNLIFLLDSLLCNAHEQYGYLVIRYLHFYTIDTFSKTNSQMDKDCIAKCVARWKQCIPEDLFQTLISKIVSSSSSNKRKSVSVTETSKRSKQEIDILYALDSTPSLTGYNPQVLSLCSKIKECILNNQTIPLGMVSELQRVCQDLLPKTTLPPVTCYGVCPLFSRFGFLNSEKMRYSYSASFLEDGQRCLSSCFKIQYVCTETINELYENTQCGTCGMRFKRGEEISKHLDTHWKENEYKSKKTDRSRGYYVDVDTWCNDDYGPSAPPPIEEPKKEIKSPFWVRCNEEVTVCAICNDVLFPKFCAEQEAWGVPDAFRITEDKSKYQVVYEKYNTPDQKERKQLIEFRYKNKVVENKCYAAFLVTHEHFKPASAPVPTSTSTSASQSFTIQECYISHKELQSLSQG